VEKKGAASVRGRATLGLSVVSALVTMTVSMSMLGSPVPSIRGKSMIALALGAMVVVGALWMLARDSSRRRA